MVIAACAASVLRSCHLWMFCDLHRKAKDRITEHIYSLINMSRLFRLPIRNAARKSKIFTRTFYEGDVLEPFHPIPNRKPKYMSANEAVKVVKTGEKRRKGFRPISNGASFCRPIRLFIFQKKEICER